MTTISEGIIVISDEANLGNPSADFVFEGFGARIRVGESHETSRSFTGDSKLIEVRPGKHLTINGEISGTGGLQKSGSETMTLTAPNTYEGFTTVSGGTLLVDNSSGSGTGSGIVSVLSQNTLGGNGTLDGPVRFFGATLAPGNSTGVISFASDLSLRDQSTLSIEIAGVNEAGPVQYDQVAVAGTALLFGDGNTLHVDLINGFTPAHGDVFTILEARQIDGAFTQYTGDVFVLDSDLALVPVIVPDDPANGGADVIQIITTAPGDANLDFQVDARDLNTVALNWQQAGDGWGAGDFNQDGFVDAGDLNLLALNWQSGVPGTNLISFESAWSQAPAGLSEAVVPEPALMVVLASGFVTLVIRRRR